MPNKKNETKTIHQKNIDLTLWFASIVGLSDTQSKFRKIIGLISILVGSLSVNIAEVLQQFFLHALCESSIFAVRSLFYDATFWLGYAKSTKLYKGESEECLI